MRKAEKEKSRNPAKELPRGMVPTMVKKLLTRKEAAALLRVSLPTLDAERSTGHLAYIQRKSGGKVWITEEAVAEYLARATHPAKPEHRMSRNTYRQRRA